MKKTVLALLLAGSGTLLAMPAQAMFCSAGTQTEGISEGNMTYDGADADDCYGVVAGNINDQTALDPIVGGTWGTGWEFLVQGDNPAGESGTFDGYTFTLTWDQAGTWTLSATGVPLPAAFDFVGALKGSTKYALWFFDDIIVDTTATGGTWEIVFLNNGGQVPDLSHLSLFIRAGEDPEEPPEEIPEPGSLALLGLGLGGLALLRRRRKA